jgi:DNA-binding LytR/AlgR family response regulator
VARAASGRCHTVFTTAYDSHAVAAFDAGAVDYLLKPIAADRLAQAVARLQARLAAQQPAADLDAWSAELAGRLATSTGRRAAGHCASRCAG